MYSVLKQYIEKTEFKKHAQTLENRLKIVSSAKNNAINNDSSWLLAKKPINGYSCASCESYLGDLKDYTDTYVLWNKYPKRRELLQESYYRMGEGYSKWLSTTNVELNRSAEILPEIKKRTKVVKEESFLNNAQVRRQNVLEGRSVIREEDEKAERPENAEPKLVKIIKHKK